MFSTEPMLSSIRNTASFAPLKESMNSEAQFLDNRSPACTYPWRGPYKAAAEPATLHIKISRGSFNSYYSTDTNSLLFRPTVGLNVRSVGIGSGATNVSHGSSRAVQLYDTRGREILIVRTSWHKKRTVQYRDRRGEWKEPPWHELDGGEGDSFHLPM